MKPRIFIAMHYLELGGAETALVGLLNALDSSRVDVDLFLYDHRGEMMQFVPKWVNLLPVIPKYTMLERPISELIKKGYWLIATARLWAKHLSNKTYKKYVNSVNATPLGNGGTYDKIALCTTPLLPKINPNVNYDLAISFLTPHRIVLDNVHAKKKIAWIHTDYTRFWVDVEEELKVWSKYDYIASISNDVSNTFLQVFPSLKNKIIEIENILSPAFVRNRAKLKDVESQIKSKDTTTILSIGRYTSQKNFDNIPDICLRLVHKGLNVKWYLIGYGDEDFVRKNITATGMEDRVILLGKKTNPYPYIKACDIYIQPSRFEGKSVTVREAQMLCKPVVITNYPTATSQVKTGFDGVIVPMDNEGCAKGIAEVICDKPLQEKLISYLQTHDYGNEKEVEKIYKLLGI